MSKAKTERRFVYGINTNGEAGSPAMYAGEYEEVAGRIDYTSGPGFYYDKILQSEVGESGVISEEEAKEAGFKAIMMALEEYHVRDTPFALALAEEGIEIAKKIGWI